MPRLTLWGIDSYLDKKLFEGIAVPEAANKDMLVDTIMFESGDLYPYIQQPYFLGANIRNWFARMLPQFEKMFEALNAEYNPIENYNRYEHWTDNRDIANADNRTNNIDTDYSSNKTTDFVSDTKTDYKSDTTTNLESNSHTNYDSNTENEANSTSQGTGDRVDKVSAYDTEAFSNSARTDSNNTATDKSTANGHQADVTESTRTDDTTGNQTDETIGKQTDKTTAGIIDKTSVDNLYSSTFQSDDDLVHDGRIHGNIGVTTSQAMVLEELELRRYDIYLEIARMFETRFIVQNY